LRASLAYRRLNHMTVLGCSTEVHQIDPGD
jgi:hypothetical protein